MNYIITNIEPPESGLDEIEELLGYRPTVLMTTERIKTKWNPWHRSMWGDFNWLRSLFPKDATLRCYLTKQKHLEQAGITTHLGMYDVVDGDDVYDFYIGLPATLDARAKANGFRTNLAWLYCHEKLHGKLAFAGTPDIVHTMEEQGRLKELIEQYVTHQPEAVNVPEVVITHHALSLPTHTVDDVDQWHKERKFPKSRMGYYVGYHYIIHADGTVVQTRHHDEEGAHTLGMNKRSIGVCFMGNFDNDLPTKEQNDAWVELYNSLRVLYPDIPTAPHRAFSNRTCHGTRLTDDYFELVSQRYTLQMRVLMLGSKLLSRLLGT